MGCVQSKCNKRQGLFHQQEELLQKGNHESSNNNKTWTSNSSTSEVSPPIPPPRSRHSPPVSRQSPPLSRHSPPVSRPSHPSPHVAVQLEGLGSLSEVWSEGEQWVKFVEWLRGQSEGEDSEGRQLSLDRYARWLELYSMLYRCEREEEGEDMVGAVTRDILEHREGFLDRERCLRCWDGGMRSEAMRKYKQGTIGVQLFLPLYPRLVDWLAEKLGSYQNHVLAINSR